MTARSRPLQAWRLGALLLLAVLVPAACSPEEPPAREPAEPGDAAAPDEEEEVAPAPTGQADDDAPEEPDTPQLVANPRTAATDFQAGVSVMIYGNEEPDAFQDKTDRVLDRLAGVGANAVSVVFPIFQEHWTANEVYADEAQTPSDDRLRTFVQAANERRFTVMLRPILDEQSLIPDGQWRGSIRPSDRDAWFASYTSLLVDYAGLAQDEAAEFLVIGSELTSLQDDGARWQSLVDEVGAHYDGELVYAANWDAPFGEVNEALEWHGIDAFYPLEAPDGADVDQLAAAWEPWLDQLAAAGVPTEQVLFTEIGVRAQRGAHRRPFVWDHGTPTDVDAQRAYYEAACERLVPVLGGLYWWVVDFDYPEEAREPESFSPLGKPAEDALERCYTETVPG